MNESLWVVGGEWQYDNCATIETSEPYLRKCETTLDEYCPTYHFLLREHMRASDLIYMINELCCKYKQGFTILGETTWKNAMAPLMAIEECDGKCVLYTERHDTYRQWRRTHDGYKPHMSGEHLMKMLYYFICKYGNFNLYIPKNADGSILAPVKKCQILTEHIIILAD